MGSSSSKNRLPPPGQYPGFAGQQYGIQSYLYAPQFMPPQIYPSGYVPSEQRRKRRRRRSEPDSYPPGFVPSNYQQPRSVPQPEPVVPTNAYQQVSFAGGSQQPSNPALRRQVHTPYPSHVPTLDSDAAARPQPAPMPQPAPNAPPMGASGAEPDLARSLQPMTPANPAVYGPTDLPRIPGPRSPLTNPLPPPPRDLYEFSPYNALLNLPQTTALLTASYSNQLTVGDGMKRSKTGLFGGGGNGKQSGGIFRSLSFSRKPPPSQNKPDVKFVPVFVDRQTGAASIQGSSSSSTPPLAGGGGGVVPPPGAVAGPSFQPQQDQSRSVPSRTWYNQSTPGPSRTPVPQPPYGQPTYGGPQPGPSSQQPLIVPPIVFSQSTPDYFGFLNHAPFRVMYQNITYPSATHLFEALKYIPDNTAPLPPGWVPRPELAQQICLTRNASEVYALSGSFKQYERPDWGLVFLRVMEDVLYTKFKQHPNLRGLLMRTAPAEIIYQDPEDTFWSDGRRPDDPPDGFPGPGENQLGKLLVKVRERLRAEGYSMDN